MYQFIQDAVLVFRPGLSLMFTLDNWREFSNHTSGPRVVEDKPTLPRMGISLEGVHDQVCKLVCVLYAAQDIYYLGGVRSGDTLVLQLMVLMAEFVTWGSCRYWHVCGYGSSSSAVTHLRIPK